MTGRFEKGKWVEGEQVRPTASQTITIISGSFVGDPSKLAKEINSNVNSRLRNFNRIGSRYSFSPLIGEQIPPTEEMVCIPASALHYHQKHTLKQAETLRYYRSMTLWQRIRFVIFPGSMLR